MDLKLSVLDVAGRIEETVELAPLAERLGYARYWIAEHQPEPSPILVASIVAGLTQQIRVGTAGILLHYYAPLRAAHDFHFLERAYEGRIDAGFCGGIAPKTPPAELDGVDIQTRAAGYPDRAARLVRYLRNTPGNADYDEALAWSGALDDPPQIWSLGGGARSAELAASLGTSFGYSLLYGISIDDPACVKSYRTQFKPVASQREPRVAIAVCGVCDETDDAARAFAATLPGHFFVPRIVGGPETCIDQMRALAERYETDEIVFADLCVGAARARCYQLLAAAR